MPDIFLLFVYPLMKEPQKHCFPMNTTGFVPLVLIHTVAGGIFMFWLLLLFLFLFKGIYRMLRHLLPYCHDILVFAWF